MEEQPAYKLLMYNDDIHSFPYIMACLIRFCEHEPLQAEQCAFLAHNNGKCSVKSGDFIELLEIHNNFEKVDVKTEIVTHAGIMY